MRYTLTYEAMPCTRGSPYHKTVLSIAVVIHAYEHLTCDKAHESAATDILLSRSGVDHINDYQGHPQISS